MERKRRNTTKLTQGKRNIISALINEYDIKSAQDIQDALKDLLGGTIQEMLEAEMTQHLGYTPYERSESLTLVMEENLKLFLVNMAKLKLKFLKIEKELLNHRL
ncbi:transposase [Fusobacterium sp. SYSU M8A802]